MKYPMCEMCGETKVEVQADEAGLCEECFSMAFREIMAPSGLRANSCGKPLFYEGRLVAVCLIERGIEHSHGLCKMVQS